MKKICFLGCIMLFGICSIRGQSIEQRVFSTSGQSGGQFAYTIGEPLTNTFNAQNAVLTQGFHQTKLSTVGIDEISNAIGVGIFPNPTQNYFTISITGYDKPLISQILDLQGKILHKQLVLSGQPISVKELANGTYIISILTDGNQIVSHHKLIKF